MSCKESGYPPSTQRPETLPDRSTARLVPFLVFSDRRSLSTLIMTLRPSSLAFL